MKISLATNFDDTLIDKIKDYPIYEIYGKMKEDILGGGRPDNTLKEVSKKRLEEHVKKVRDAGFKFNYLLNGSCLSNHEQSEKCQKEFIKFLTYLSSIGVNALTVSNPFILKLIKKNFDNFTVRISTFACVDNYEKAKFWEDMGADIICVDFVKINRDFKTLKYMIDHLKKSKIEILVTNSCIKNCPYIYAHTSALSHASNCYDDNNKYVDWCLLTCQKHQLDNEYEYIKSPWIRPEDIKYYEKIGIEHFKLTERDFPTSELVKRVKAYTNRSYDGNLLDLIQGHGWTTGINDNYKIDVNKQFTNKEDVLNEIYKIRGLGCERKFPRHIFIDNKKLDGFIEYFVSNKCTGHCNECGYCKSIAKKVITNNEEIINYLKYLYNLYDDMKLINKQ